MSVSFGSTHQPHDPTSSGEGQLTGLLDYAPPHPFTRSQLYQVLFRGQYLPVLLPPQAPKVTAPHDRGRRVAVRKEYVSWPRRIPTCLKRKA